MEVNANRWYLILNSNVNTIAVSGEIYVKNSKEQTFKNETYPQALIQKSCQPSLQNVSQKIHSVAKTINFVDHAKRVYRLFLTRFRF